MIEGEYHKNMHTHAFSDFLIIIQKLIVKVKKGEIVDLLHDQGHD